MREVGKGFRWPTNIANEASSEIKVFEGAIDLASYMDIFGEMETNLLALGMLSDAPLVTFLREHPSVEKICFCLDNDLPGRKAAEEQMGKYEALGYEVSDGLLPGQYKDFNEWLVDMKESVRDARTGERSCRSF